MFYEFIEEDEGPSVEDLTKIQENTTKVIFQQMSIIYFYNMIVSHGCDAGEAETRNAYLREKIEEYNKKYEKAHKKCEEITVNMSSEYTAVRESLIVQITGLKNTITELQNQLEIAKETLKKTKEEKNKIISQREQEIVQMKIRMEQMTNEFGEMLKAVLDKMSERIEVTNTSWSGGDVPMIRKLEEYNLGEKKEGEEESKV